MARDASKLASPKRKQSFAHSRSVMVPQRFSSARACSRFAAVGSLLPGVGRLAWIAVEWSSSWLGSHAGVMAHDASKLASPKRKQSFTHSKNVLVPQRFLSARACSRFAAVGSLLPGVGRCAWIAVKRSSSWLGSRAGVMARDASKLASPKRKQSFAHSRSVFVPQRFLSARACSRFAEDGSLLPGVERCAWIAV